MKKKIALIGNPLFLMNSDQSNDGEQSSSVGNVAHCLGQLGYRVDVFTRTDHHHLPYVYEWDENVRLIHVPLVVADVSETSPTHIRNFVTFIIDFCSGQEKSYDLIHASFGLSGWVAAEIKSKLGVPFVLTFHAPGGTARQEHEFGDAFPEFRTDIQGRLVREADGILADTPQDRQDLISIYHADPTYIVQIPSSTYQAEGPAWQTGTNLLVEFYENVLAVRRVAISQGLPALYLPNQSENDTKRQIELMENAFESALQNVQETRARLGNHILAAANLMIECVSLGGRIIVCDDGTGMVNARHISADLFRRGGLPAIPLITDTSMLMDGLKGMDYDAMLSRQVAVVGRPGDLLVGITVQDYTGRLMRAFQTARAKDIRCISLLGEAGEEVQILSDVMLNIPGHNVQRVLEAQVVILHILYDLVGKKVHSNQQLPAEPLFGAASAITMSGRLIE